MLKQKKWYSVLKEFSGGKNLRIWDLKISYQSFSFACFLLSWLCQVLTSNPDVKQVSFKISFSDSSNIVTEKLRFFFSFCLPSRLKCLKSGATQVSKKKLPKWNLTRSPSALYCGWVTNPGQAPSRVWAGDLPINMTP